MASQNISTKRKFYRQEVNRTLFEIPSNYQDLAALGSGGYGTVCSAIDKDTGARVAIKKLVRPFQTDIHAKRVYREIRLLKHMHHDNIIELIDAFTTATSLRTFDDVYFVTPMVGDDLAKLLRTQRFNDDHIQFLIYQILRGLKYIHSAGLIHRDLKPENIAVSNDNELRILDFGLARPVSDEMTGYVATRWYRAPEILLSWMHYSQSVDTWSVGCILAEMILGKVLFKGASSPVDVCTFNINQLVLIMTLTGLPNSQLLAKLTSEEAKNFLSQLSNLKRQDFYQYFKGANPKAIDLLEKLLELDPDLRLTVEQALAHPYLQTYADDTDEPTAPLYVHDVNEEEKDIKYWKGVFGCADLIYKEIISTVKRSPGDMS